MDSPERNNRKRPRRNLVRIDYCQTSVNEEMSDSMSKSSTPSEYIGSGDIEEEIQEEYESEVGTNENECQLTMCSFNEYDEYCDSSMINSGSNIVELKDEEKILGDILEEYINEECQQNVSSSIENEALILKQNYKISEKLNQEIIAKRKLICEELKEQINAMPYGFPVKIINDSNNSNNNNDGNNISINNIINDNNSSNINSINNIINSNSVNKFLSFDSKNINDYKTMDEYIQTVRLYNQIHNSKHTSDPKTSKIKFQLCLPTLVCDSGKYTVVYLRKCVLEYPNLIPDNHFYKYRDKVVNDMLAQTLLQLGHQMMPNASKEQLINYIISNDLKGVKSFCMHFLGEEIESILNSTYQHIELKNNGYFDLNFEELKDASPQNTKEKLCYCSLYHEKHVICYDLKSAERLINILSSPSYIVIDPLMVHSFHVMFENNTKLRFIESNLIKYISNDINIDFIQDNIKELPNLISPGFFKRELVIVEEKKVEIEPYFLGLMMNYNANILGTRARNLLTRKYNNIFKYPDNTVNLLCQKLLDPESLWFLPIHYISTIPSFVFEGSVEFKYRFICGFLQYRSRPLTRMKCFVFYAQESPLRILFLSLLDSLQIEYYYEFESEMLFLAKEFNIIKYSLV